MKIERKRDKEREIKEREREKERERRERERERERNSVANKLLSIYDRMCLYLCPFANGFSFF